jgi:hypothetical protein
VRCDGALPLAFSRLLPSGRLLRGDPPAIFPV